MLFIVNRVNWQALEEHEYKELVKKLETDCIGAERIGYILSNTGIHPAIRIDTSLYNKLVHAGPIDVVSRINTKTVGLHFYVELELHWDSIRKDLTTLFNGWRDRRWLEVLRDVQEVALTPQNFRTRKPSYGAIIVDGLNVDKLKLILATTSLFHPPKDFPFVEQGGSKNVENHRVLP